MLLHFCVPTELLNKNVQRSPRSASLKQYCSQEWSEWQVSRARARHEDKIKIKKFIGYKSGDSSKTNTNKNPHLQDKMEASVVALANAETEKKLAY